jgi:hypothetical protein
MKRKRTVPFPLVKAKTGRYTMRTTDRALELRAKDPALWRKLPAQLRHEAEAAEAAEKAAAAASGGARAGLEMVTAAQQRLDEAREVYERIHPKLRALAEVDVSVGNLEIPDVMNNPALEATANYLKVPGHRGRWPDKKTAELCRRVRQLLRQGVTQHQIARRLEVDYHALRSLVQRYGLKPRS